MTLGNGTMSLEPRPQLGVILEPAAGALQHLFRLLFHGMSIAQPLHESFLSAGHNILPPVSHRLSTASLVGRSIAASNSGPLFFTLPTALLTGRLPDPARRLEG